jgi:hypothetical protein
MKSFKLLFLIIFLSGTFMNCNKTDISCPDDDEFCALIDAENYGKALDIIDKFVSLFDKNLTENEKLEKIEVWLKCKSCISNAEILCNSCILTYPPQSEIKIWFKINGEVKIKILDVLMSEPLKTMRFHD